LRACDRDTRHLAGRAGDPGSFGRFADGKIDRAWRAMPLKINSSGYIQFPRGKVD
jgi:hypothetical protein